MLAHATSRQCWCNSQPKGERNNLRSILLRVPTLLRRASASALKLRGLKEAKDVGPIGRLSGRLVDLGDGVGLLHTRYCLGAGHQHGRLGGLDGASCGNGQRDGSHALIVGDIGDDGKIVVTKTIPTTNEFAPNGLACSTAHGFNSVLRLFELGG